MTSKLRIDEIVDSTDTGSPAFPLGVTTTALSYTGTLTGSTGVINIGSGQVYKDASGNVGIGTSVPSEKLEIESGNVRLGENSVIFNNSTLDIRANNAMTSTAHALNLVARGPNDRIVFETDNTERATIDSAGNVGIGTSSPSAGLEVGGSPTRNILLSSTSGSSLHLRTDGTDSFVTTKNDFLSNGSTNNQALILGAQTDLKFNTGSAGGAGSERARIDSSGNLLVGTTSVVAGSTFYGTAARGTNSAIGIVDELSQSGTLGLDNSGNFAITAEDGEVLVIDSSDNITTVSPHNFEMIPDGKSEDMAWAFYSRNGDTENDYNNTKFIAVDMAKMIRTVENLTGSKLIYTGTGSEDDGSTVEQNIIQDLINRIEQLEAQIDSGA